MKRFFLKNRNAKSSGENKRSTNIIDAIKDGPKDEIHDITSIEKMIDKVTNCDIALFANSIDEETKLNIPSLCHLILPRVPSNMKSIYNQSLLKRLNLVKYLKK